MVIIDETIETIVYITTRIYISFIFKLYYNSILFKIII